MFKDETSPEKANAVVGSRQWFSVPFESRTENHDQQSLNDSDSSDLPPEQAAHISYNTVKQDVKVGFIYIRKQYDEQIDVCFKAMVGVFKAALRDYLQAIQEKIIAGEEEKLDLFTSTKLFPQDDKNPVKEDLASIFDDTETKEKIFNIWDKTTDSNHTVTITDEIIDVEILKGMATARAADPFFKGPFEGRKLEELMSLTTQGFIYQPPMGDHSWEANLGWLLSHLHKRGLDHHNQNAWYKAPPDIPVNLASMLRTIPTLVYNTATH